MINRILIALALSASISTAALAGNFYQKAAAGGWAVFGDTGNEANKQNPACYAEYRWQDGSVVQLIQDLKDGELYLYVQNMAWEVQDPPGKFNLRMNFYGGNSVKGGNIDFDLINKNTVIIRGINPDAFIPDFMAYEVLRLIMPGSVANAVIPLQGTKDAMVKMVECLDAAKKLLDQNVKPGTKI